MNEYANESPGASPHDVPLPELPGTRHSWLDLPTKVRLHVAELGPADGDAVVALHGWPQHWWMWREVAPALAADGHRVVCPDLRGLGWSGLPAQLDFTKERLTDDVLALIDALGLESVDLLGHDWGGWVAFLLARREPQRVRRLRACSIAAPWQRGGSLSRRDFAFAYQPLVGAPVVGPALIRDTRLVEQLLRHGTAPSHSWRPGALEPYLEVLRVPSVADAASRLYRDFLGREMVPLMRSTTPAPELPMPVLQLMGSTDIVRGRTGDRAPRAADWTLELVPDCGHYMVDERPEVVTSRARAFFAAS